MTCELDCVRGRLCTGVNGDLEPPRVDVMKNSAARSSVESKIPLTVVPSARISVEPAVDKEVDVRRECVLVQRRAAVAQRRDRGGE